MKKFALIAALLVATPASAAEITWKLNDQEQQQLFALLDLAAKQGGANAAGAVAYFIQKLKTPGPEALAAPEPKK